MKVFGILFGNVIQKAHKIFLNYKKSFIFAFPKKTIKQIDKEVAKILEVYNGSVCTFEVQKPTKKSVKAIFASTGTASTDAVSLIHAIRE